MKVFLLFAFPMFCAAACSKEPQDAIYPKNDAVQDAPKEFISPEAPAPQADGQEEVYQDSESAGNALLNKVIDNLYPLELISLSRNSILKAFRRQGLPRIFVVWRVSWQDPDKNIVHRRTEHWILYWKEEAENILGAFFANRIERDLPRYAAYMRGLGKWEYDGRSYPIEANQSVPGLSSAMLEEEAEEFREFLDVGDLVSAGIPPKNAEIVEIWIAPDLDPEALLLCHYYSF